MMERSGYQNVKTRNQSNDVSSSARVGGAASTRSQAFSWRAQPAGALGSQTWHARLQHAQLQAMQHFASAYFDSPW